MVTASAGRLLEKKQLSSNIEV